MFRTNCDLVSDHIYLVEYQESCYLCTTDGTGNFKIQKQLYGEVRAPWLNPFSEIDSKVILLTPEQEELVNTLSECRCEYEVCTCHLKHPLMQELLKGEVDILFGRTSPHEEVMERLRKKYDDAPKSS